MPAQIGNGLTNLNLTFDLRCRKPFYGISVMTDNQIREVELVKRFSNGLTVTFSLSMSKGE